jgi:ribonuclease HI
LKHYDHSSNNVIEISGVIAALSFLPQGMIVWISTDAQYVQNGITEWIHGWKRNGWKNSKKAPVANKTLWMQLDSEIARHRPVEFSWVKAHSGIVHHEIADQLATRRVNGPSNCLTQRFDVLPEGSETEANETLKRTLKPNSVTTQTDKWDEEHLPTVAVRADRQGLEADDDRARQQAICNRFSWDVLGNSSEPVSEDSGSDMQIADSESRTIITGETYSWRIKLRLDHQRYINHGLHIR